MDLRFNYDHIRQQIQDADFGCLDNNSLLVRDIRFQMNTHVEIIEALEQQRKDIDEQIKQERINLKELAEKWEV